MRLKLDIPRKRLHLITGLCLGLFLLTHFLNHALGLISVDAMEKGRELFNILWRSWIGTVLLYGSLLTHFILALDSLYRRQTLRMPPREALKIIFGLALPFMLVSHVTATRIEWMLSGYAASYYDVLGGLWSRPPDAFRQCVALVFAWSHGCLGFWFWMRGRDWYPRYQLLLYTVALLVPVLALLGFWVGARSLDGVTASDTWFKPARTDFEVIRDIRFWIYATLFGSIAGTLVLRALPVNGKIRVAYPDGRSISVARGFTLLEASRAAGIPHLSICGGRGRCSTCRVRIIEGMNGLPAPGDAERHTLSRIKAPGNVRLACQLRPNHNVTIAPVL